MHLPPFKKKRRKTKKGSGKNAGAWNHGGPSDHPADSFQLALAHNDRWIVALFLSPPPWRTAATFPRLTFLHSRKTTTSHNLFFYFLFHFLRHFLANRPKMLAHYSGNLGDRMGAIVWWANISPSDKAPTETAIIAGIFFFDLFRRVSFIITRNLDTEILSLSRITIVLLFSFGWQVGNEQMVRLFCSFLCVTSPKRFQTGRSAKNSNRPVFF